MTELETQKDVLYWIIVVLVPILIGVFGLYYKQTKDKERAENRLTRIESQQDQNTKSIEKLESEQLTMREEIKIIGIIKTQNEHIIKMIDEIREELRERS